MINDLKRFANRCRDCAKEDDKEFRELVLASELYTGMTTKDIAREFTCAISTVQRWKNGLSAPHPLMRPYVMRKFEERALERVIALGGKVS